MNEVELQSAYTLRAFKSDPVAVEWRSIDWEEVYKEINNGWMILWQHHAVFTGHINKADFNEKKWLNPDGAIPVLHLGQPHEDHLVRIRIFNESLEYHFWRSGELTKGRKRIDEEGDSAKCIETDMVLRPVVGKPVAASFGYSNWSEVSVNENENRPKFVICTRHYIKFCKKTQLAVYNDCRFVKFCEKP